MTRLAFRTVVAVVFLAAAAGCKGDPTADLRGGVTTLSLNPDLMFIDQGATKGLEVTVRDEQLNPVSAAVTATSNNTAVFTVAPDTTVPSADNARHNFTVTAVAPGQDRLIVSAGGVTDTAIITVLPTAFSGAFSSNTPAGGDTLTIASTSLLKFNPATLAVTFGTLPGTVVAATADTVKVLVPFGASGVLTLDGILVSYVPGLEVTLTTSQTATQTGDAWAGDDAFATAPVIPIPLTAGGVTHMISTFGGDNADQCAETAANFDFGSTGPCVIYQFTVADTTTLTFTTDWDSGADLDIYACSDADPLSCFEDPGTGATGAHPQSFTFTFPAGTHYFVVENYDGAATANIIVTIEHP